MMFLRALTLDLFFLALEISFVLEIRDDEIPNGRIVPVIEIRGKLRGEVSGPSEPLG